MARKTNQQPISKEDLQKYLYFALTGQVEDDQAAADIQRLSRRTTTLSDVSVVVEVMLNQRFEIVTKVIERLQQHELVLKAMGATEEMFEEAKLEYFNGLAQIKAELEAANAEKAEGSEEAEADELVPVAVDCLNQVEDDEGVYTLPGKRYDILEIQEDHYIIETEPNEESDSMSISKNDPDFAVVLGKEEDYGNIG